MFRQGVLHPLRRARISPLRIVRIASVGVMECLPPETTLNRLFPIDFADMTISFTRLTAAIGGRTVRIPF